MVGSQRIGCNILLNAVVALILAYLLEILVVGIGAVLAHPGVVCVVLLLLGRVVLVCSIFTL